MSLGNRAGVLVLPICMTLSGTVNPGIVLAGVPGIVALNGLVGGRLVTLLDMTLPGILGDMETLRYRFSR